MEINQIPIYIHYVNYRIASYTIAVYVNSELVGSTCDIGMLNVE